VLAAAVEAVIIRPGDTLIIRVKRDLAYPEFHELVERIGERLPGLRDRVLVINADQVLVYRPDPPVTGSAPTPDAQTIDAEVDAAVGRFLAAHPRISSVLERVEAKLPPASEVRPSGGGPTPDVSAWCGS
jgi:hypothetical protein